MPGRPAGRGRPGTAIYLPSPESDELVSGLFAVCARAATDDTNTPAAKNGASLFLMVIDESPLLCAPTVRGAGQAFHDPLVWAGHTNGDSLAGRGLDLLRHLDQLGEGSGLHLTHDLTAV